MCFNGQARPVPIEQTPDPLPSATLMRSSLLLVSGINTVSSFVQGGTYSLVPPMSMFESPSPPPVTKVDVVLVVIVEVIVRVVRLNVVVTTVVERLVVVKVDVVVVVYPRFQEHLIPAKRAIPSLGPRASVVVGFTWLMNATTASTSC